MKKGLVFIILAGIMWGTASVFVNIFAPYRFTSMQLTCIRMTVAFFLMLLFCLVSRRSALRVRIRDIPLFAVCGASLFGTATFYYEAMQLTSASTAVVLMYISPVPIMLFSVFFLGERFCLRKGIAVALMLLGCVFVAGVIGDFKPNPLGLIMGFLSAASYTVYNIFNKLEARRGIDPASSTLYTFFFGMLCSLCISRPWEIPALVGQKPALLLPMCLLISLVTSVLPYFLYSASLKQLSVGVASALSIIEPMTGALIGFLVFHDPLTPFTLSGIAMIVVSVLLLGIGEKSTSQAG